MVFAGKYTAFWVLNQIGAKTFLKHRLVFAERQQKKGSRQRATGGIRKALLVVALPGTTRNLHRIGEGEMKCRITKHIYEKTTRCKGKGL